jgi:hypothetical protein
MTHQPLAKRQNCIVMRNGIEIWIDEEKRGPLSDILLSLSSHKFIKYDGRLINSADLTGIFSPDDMADLTRRKNGQWQCEMGSWHEKGGDCQCADAARRRKAADYERESDDARMNCAVCCGKGTLDGGRECECQMAVFRKFNNL